MANREPSRVSVLRADGVDYDRALRWQHAAADAVRAQREDSDALESLALLQHTPVYTMGARGGWTNLLAPGDALTARGARLVETDRGGDITFHGPGQLVAYPILDLHRRGLHAVEYVRALEACVIATLAAFGVAGGRVPGRPGVWVAAGTGVSAAPSKIAAIGVRIARGVSRHGLALNVDTDLAWFDAIVPCGIADAGVTSMAHVLGAAPPFDAVVDAFRTAFARVFDASLAVVDPSPLTEQEVTA